MAEGFKDRMRRGERLLGFFIGTPSAATVEMAGFCGYDVVIIDTEHGPAGIESIEDMLRAAAMHGMTGLVRGRKTRTNKTTDKFILRSRHVRKGSR